MVHIKKNLKKKKFTELLTQGKKTDKSTLFMRLIPLGVRNRKK